jgi:hypothetical protein
MNSVQSSGNTTSLSKKKDSQFEVSEMGMDFGIYHKESAARKICERGKII